MLRNRRTETGGYEIERLPPCCFPPRDPGLEETPFERQRLPQGRSFRAQPPKIGWVRRIAGNSGAAVRVRAGKHAATDAAIRTGGANGPPHGSTFPNRGCP